MSRHISRILYPSRSWISIIYLMRPTPRLRRTAFKRRYTWSCNLQNERLMMLPSPPVGSYPTFSPLINLSAERLFSSSSAYPHGYLLFQKCSVLCCPDFPPLCEQKGDRTACSMQNYKMFFNIT